MTNDQRRAPYIGVIGPSEATEFDLAVAHEVGQRLAAAGATLLCGDWPG